MQYYYGKIDTGEHAGKFVKVTVNEMIKNEKGVSPIVDAKILTTEQFEYDIKNKKSIYEKPAE